jgi:adenylate cyclase
MLDFSSDYFHTFRNLKEIHLSECELQSVPPCIKALTNLVHLNLSSNRIKDISSAGLESLQYLNYINLANNRIESIPTDFKLLTNLAHLNISNNRFALFPETICLINGLTELDISFNQIKQIPESISNLKKLTTLILISNELQGSLPANICELVELKELDLRKNMISDAKSLSSLPKLEKLFCDYNSISIFESSFHSLVQLTISKNSITQLLSPQVPVLTLTDLNISSCKLVTLPDDFFTQLPSLLKLALDNNLLVSLPDSIQSLTSLEQLSCSICDLSSLPNDLSNLQSLVNLDLHGNNLKSIPTSIWTLKKLKNLNVSSNLLETFPNPQTQSKKVSFNSQHTKSDSQKSEDYEIPPLAQCLQSLFLADNRLDDVVFEPLSYLTELRALNLSYNDLTEISQGSLIHMSQLTELYLSGNQFTSLPSEEFVCLRNLESLYLNGNKLQNLPSDLRKNKKLNTLDLGSNFLKYNITNWLYDWNWNWNLELIYLNLSGNRRFKIEPNHQDNFNAKSKDLSDFSALKRLAVLGLMGVSYVIALPKETPDKRIRTDSLEINQMGYGLADSLAKKASTDHLWTWDFAIENFAKRDDSALFAIFDAHINPLYGSRITKFLNDYFPHNLLSELGKLDPKQRDVEVAIRKSFINLNKELGSTGIEEYSQMGASAIVAYVEGNTLYVANAGDAVAVICRNGGMAHLISTRHTPWSTSEIQRIRNSKGLISPQGLLNGISEISRGFGHFKLLPLINANPFIQKIELSDHDEFIILASRSLWDLMTYQTAVDIARTERDDLLYAAQKVRDFAIAYGADEGIVVMIIGVGDLFDQPIRVTKTANNNQWPEGVGIRISEHRSEEAAFSNNWKRSRRPKQTVHGDTVMNRLNPEVEAPTGQVALVFTDIKNSTFLWETVDTAMRTANRIHNLVMRRILRTYGGFEVKSEGDAFMLSFPTVASALLCCLSVQLHLLQEDWPQQILDTEEGKEIFDTGFSNDLLYRGLSVRMGIHWGSPVCEVDPTTLRMDYFGPMVNRAARICGAADGGQICVSSDVVSEIKALESMLTNEEPSTKLPRDVRLLKKIGFSIVEMGEKKLKGLEKAEILSLVFPNSLKRRLQYSTINFLESQQTMFAAPQPQTLDPAAMRTLGYQCLRLERLACDNVVSNPVSQLDLLNNFLSFQIRDDATDADLVNLLDSLIVRVENVVSTLYLSQIHQLMSLSKLADTPSEIEAVSSALSEILKIVTEYQAHKSLISRGQANTGLF